MAACPGECVVQWICTSAYDSRRGPLQIGYLDIVVLPDVQLVKLSGGEQLHQMAVAGEGLGIDGPVMDMGSQKLLVDTAAEKGGDMDIKFFGIHIIDQVHEDLFSTAVPQVVDEE